AAAKARADTGLCGRCPYGSPSRYAVDRKPAADESAAALDYNRSPGGRPEPARGRLNWGPRGRSSVGRGSASQAEGRGVEPERPLSYVDADAVEIRVLGCLIEKQRTTPDAYPLSLNSLRLAC